jgi:hypothetical protein
VRGQPRDAAIAVAFAALPVITGWWAISQSRSSTAAIGFVLLRALGGVTGLLGFGFARNRTSTSASLRVGSWVFLAAAVVLGLGPIAGGRRSVAINAARDSAQATRERELERDRESVRGIVGANSERATPMHGDSIRAQRADSASFVFDGCQRP